MAVKYTKFVVPRPSKTYQNWYFWLENKPSGSLNILLKELYLGAKRASVFLEPTLHNCLLSSSRAVKTNCSK
jgi:hypothetical protein